MRLLGPESKIRRYIPVYQCSNDGAGCMRGQWWLQAAVLLKFWFLLVNTYQDLLADQLENYGMATRFGKLSTKNTPKIIFKKPSNIHKKAKYCKFITFIF